MTADPAFSSLGQLPGGHAILGRAQFLPGYSILIAGQEHASRLTDLPRTDRLAFLNGMEKLGEAVELVCRRYDSRFRRINLEIHGNLVPSLHAHVWPRYEWEPDDVKVCPVGRYPDACWQDPQTRLGPQHTNLRDALRTQIHRLVATTTADAERT